MLNRFSEHYACEFSQQHEHSQVSPVILKARPCHAKKYGRIFERRKRINDLSVLRSPHSVTLIQGHLRRQICLIQVDS